LRLVRQLTCAALLFSFALGQTRLAWAKEVGIFRNGRLDARAFLQAGGLFGYLTIGLSVVMVAMIIEHLLSIRRSTLIPRPVAMELQKLIAANQITQADQLCKNSPCLLTAIVQAGLQALPFGYESAEKAMEDTAQEYSARLARKVDYLSVIGAVAPMMGLTGTVWGMIQAFGEFAEQANPSPSDFAPSISEALVTTLLGLVVAIPAMSAHAWFRNRADEFIAEAALLSEKLLSVQRRRRKPEPALPTAIPDVTRTRP